MILPGTYQNGFAPRDGEPLYPELQVGCVGDWSPCLGPTGTVLRDWSGRANHGTLENMDPGTDWTPSDGRWALDFDGSNDYVDAGSASLLNFERTDPFSISAWIKHDVLGSDDCFVSRRQASNVRGYAFYVTVGNKLEVVLQSATGNRIRRVGSTNIATDTWYHAMFTYNGSSSASGVSIYLNGARETETTSQDNLSATMQSTGTFQIGDQTVLSLPWDGSIDGVQIYNRTLSPQENKLLALRRGIAHELAPVRYSGESAGFLAAWRRQQSFIIGGGLQ